MRLLLLALLLTPPAIASLPEARPEALGIDPSRLARVEDAIARAIGEKTVPGAVVLVGRKGKIAMARAFGKRSVEPTDEPMTRDTVFDMASLTKPVATATSVMVLLERGKFRLSDPIVRHLPELKGNGKDAITIDQLLRHRTGLIPDNPIADYADGPEKAWSRIAELAPTRPPGEAFIYSDVNYLILGRLVEKISGQSLDQFARATIFDPLGMVDSGFRPVGGPVDEPTPLARVAPTEPEGGKMIRGVVHDPRSRALGGVAGHAGLFSTVDDLAIYAQMILDGGQGPNGKRILSPLTVRAMTDPGSTPEGQRRGLGWDIETSFSSPRGSLFGPGSFGHTGFTGTSIWIDPETETFVILLTSRLHPDGKGGSPVALRAEVATLVASSIMDVSPRVVERSAVVPAPSAPVLPAIRPVDCGIDVLARREFRELKDKRVGLVTNHTGRDKAGVPTIDLLFGAPDVELVALFSPEHGIRGEVDTTVADAKDPKTGLPIFSLYGKTRKPSPESLAGVEVLVYDIQDIGTRYYTYISTLGLVLEAARENHIPVIVLDRPNPIGGEAIAGPVRDADFASFIAHHALPVRHAMTVGEMAKLFNAERSIGADLTVIPVEGWRRSDTFDRTGLEWTNPSPNMRSLTEALLYPGVGLLEASNLATGRGTDTPFERLGAPWIDDRAFAKALNELALPGVRFVPVRFSPRERQFKDQECKGVQIAITDWATFEPVDLGISIAITLRSMYPKQWQPEGFLKMLADRDAYEALLSGADLSAIRSTWDGELAEFAKVREKYLLYK
ncbi:exo-beta-N-acetylmuramidase NamZ domain-containing protein [Tundrisphaera lichenicola]|uniref:exo-beta-N-acetylmuramidase NamZ domain-containing protein n=1 Tax=Tundrisphaera lichenicola TaxID=2029860 RepID=UPI003EBF7222